MSPDKLKRMANQIAEFFDAQDRDAAPAAIADHLLKFWDPRMRRDLIASIESGGTDGLSPSVVAAVKTLRQSHPAGH